MSPEFPGAGLLEGAHTGHGLGHEFLRHIQRCRMLVHVLDGTSPDAVGDFRAIQTELELFNPEIATKPQVGLCCGGACRQCSYSDSDGAAAAEYGHRHQAAGEPGLQPSVLPS